MINSLFPDLLHVCGNLDRLVDYYKTKWILDNACIVPYAAKDAYDPVVLRYSLVDANVMPPWRLVGLLPPGDYRGEIWNDPRNLDELSRKQKRKFAKWMRYFDIQTDAQIFVSNVCASRVRQGFVGDCSYLSSLNSLADYENKYNVPILSNIISYIDLFDLKELKKLENYGINVEDFTGCNNVFRVGVGVKLHFNGVERCVLVDDWVPVKENNGLLCAHSSNPREFWITLLEKAFVKLLGGTFAVQGTNPGVDIYHLTGWIPEIIPVPSTANCSMNNRQGHLLRHRKESKHVSSRWDAIWDSLYAGFKIGTCVLCLGTNTISDATKSTLGFTEGISISTGIVADHAYSVLDVQQVAMPSGQVIRILKAKNPWGRMSYNGKFSPNDVDTWTHELCDALGYTPPREDDGIFWIQWEEILKWFSHLYIIWRPDVFCRFYTLHTTWKPSDKFLESLVPEDVYFAAFNPQIKLTIDFKDADVAIVWILLLQYRNAGNANFKYLAMHLFDVVNPIACPTIPSVQGVYNNGECNLFKLIIKRNKQASIDLEKMLLGNVLVLQKHHHTHDTINPPLTNGKCNTHEMTLLLSYYLQKIKEPLPLTLRAFSNVDVKLEMQQSVIGDDWHREIYWGEWNDSNSGGSPHNTWQYLTNPHFRLEFSMDTRAVVLLECKAPASVNLRIFKGRIVTVRTLKNKMDLIRGDYKLYASGALLDIKAGVYTAIASTFRPGEYYKFRLVVHYQYGKVKLAPLPYPHAGILKGMNLYVKEHKTTSNIVDIMVSKPTDVAIRIQRCPTKCAVLLTCSSAANFPQPRDSSSTCTQFDPNLFCEDVICVKCGGPGGRFHMLDNDEKCKFKEHGRDYDMAVFCDLMGGTSNNGRVKSAASESLFFKQATINFTLVHLLASQVPYRLVLLDKENTLAHGNVHNGSFIKDRIAYTFTSNEPISIV